jgi:hypothetical protein
MMSFLTIDMQDICPTPSGSKVIEIGVKGSRLKDVTLEGKSKEQVQKTCGQYQKWELVSTYLNYSTIFLEQIVHGLFCTLQKRIKASRTCSNNSKSSMHFCTTLIIKVLLPTFYWCECGRV